MSNTPPAEPGTRPDDAHPGTPVGGFEPPKGDETDFVDFGKGGAPTPKPADEEPKTPVVSEEVLRNKGVPIVLYVLDDAGNRVDGSDGKPQTIERFLRLDANSIAELEEAYDGVKFEITELVTQGPEAGQVVRFEKAFYGIDGFQASLERRTTGTLLKALSIALGEPREVMGKLLVDGEMGTYHTAFGAAFSMANGADPQVASRMIEMSVEAQHRQSEKMKAEMDKDFEALAEEADEAEGD